MRAKKVLAILGIILLLVVAGVISFLLFQNPDVPNVSSLSMVDSSDTYVKLHWNKADAEGYIIYQLDENNDSIELAKIDSANTVEYTIDNLSGAQEYKFSIVAYMTRGDKVIKSEKPNTTKAYTVPSVQKIVNIDSDTPGAFNVEWLVDSKANGYQIQYVKGKTDDFSSAKTIDVEEKTMVFYNAKKLAENQKYSVRVRSYVIFDKERQYGKWSEVKTITTTETVELPENIVSDKPMIALTFDDGPGYNSASDDILDILEKYDAKATFFMVGENASVFPDNLKRKVELGMEIGNHTYDHNHYGKNVTKSDIKKASDAIYNACGQYPTAFRSPGGNTTDTILKECKNEKMALYYWSVDTEDWKSKDADEIYKVVMDSVSDGDIILMHEIYPSTAKALKKLVPALQKKGYQLVTCQELINAKTGKSPKAGEQYVDAYTVNNHTS